MTTPSGCAAWATLDDLPDQAVGMWSPTEWCGWLGMATDILWAATGRRWRGGPLTAEAVLRAAPPRPGEGAWPYHRSWGECACYDGISVLGPAWSDRVGHHELAAIRLPHPDVVMVSSVLVDGEPFAAWRLDGNYLVRVDGCGWPLCHDRATVTYQYGRTPPVAGVIACVELAVELARGASSDPDQPCRLPQRLQSVSRQGISFAVLDNMEFLGEGLTGLYACDAWIKSVNPWGRKASASVWSPDIARSRRTP